MDAARVIIKGVDDQCNNAGPMTLTLDAQRVPHDIRLNVGRYAGDSGDSGAGLALGTLHKDAVCAMVGAMGGNPARPARPRGNSQ